MRRCTVCLSLLLAVLMCASLAHALKNPPPGFRSIPWGADLDDISDMVPFEKDPTMNTSQLECCNRYEKCYVREDEKLSAGNSPLTQIIYCSINGRFSSVLVVFPTSSFPEIKEILDYKYGAGTLGDGSAQPCTTNCVWKWPEVEMRLNKMMNTILYRNTMVRQAEEEKLKELFEEKLDDL